MVNVLRLNWYKKHYFTLSGAYLQLGIPRLVSPTLLTYLRIQDSYDSTVRPPLSVFWRNHPMQPHLRIILASPEPRNIFYFLLLNHLLLLVQMLHGVRTNSLDLISDTIHTSFDYMAIVIGLFASVMSGWGKDERFTYGCGIGDALSGFAKGIVIVYEAVQ